MILNSPNPFHQRSEDFKFVSCCNLRIFEEELPPTFNQLLAISPKRGIIFVGGYCCIKLIASRHLFNEVEPNAAREGLRCFPCCTINLPATPSHIDISCDEEYIALVYDVQCIPVLFIHSIDKFFLNENSSLVQELHIVNSTETVVSELLWNPGVPNMIAYCLSNGSVGICTFSEGGVLEINTLPPESNSTCLCWSPKGKQLVVGTFHGELIQYKVELKAMKRIAAPQKSDVNCSVSNVKWLSNFQFIATYKNVANEDDMPMVMIVNAPKNEAVNFVDYTDVCETVREPVIHRYYFIHQPNWNILLIASASASNIAVLGLAADGTTWIKWEIDDLVRAELPLDKYNETYPVGIGLDYSSKIELSTETIKYPRMPILWILSNHGLLCSFYVVNTLPNTAKLCYDPTIPLSDDIIKMFFTADSNDLEVAEEEQDNALCSNEVEYVNEPAPPDQTDVYEFTYDNENEEHVKIVELSDAENVSDNNQIEEPEEQRYVNFEPQKEEKVNDVLSEVDKSENESFAVKKNSVKIIQSGAQITLNVKKKMVVTNVSRYSTLKVKKQLKALTDVLLYTKRMSCLLNSNTVNSQKCVEEMVTDRYPKDFCENRIKQMISDFTSELNKIKFTVNKQLKQVDYDDEQLYEISDGLNKLNLFASNLKETTASLESDVADLKSCLVKLLNQYEKLRSLYHNIKDKRLPLLTSYDVKSIYENTVHDFEHELQVVELNVVKVNRRLNEINQDKCTRKNKNEILKEINGMLQKQKEKVYKYHKRLENLETQMRLDSRYSYYDDRSELAELKCLNASYSEQIKDTLKYRLTDNSAPIADGNRGCEDGGSERIRNVALRTSYKFNRDKLEKLKEAISNRKLHVISKCNSFTINIDVDRDDGDVNTAIVPSIPFESAPTPSTSISRLDETAKSVLKLEETLQKSPLTLLIANYACQNLSNCTSPDEYVKRINCCITRALANTNLFLSETNKIKQPSAFARRSRRHRTKLIIVNQTTAAISSQSEIPAVPAPPTIVKPSQPVFVAPSSSAMTWNISNITSTAKLPAANNTMSAFSASGTVSNITNTTPSFVINSGASSFGGSNTILFSTLSKSSTSSNVAAFSVGAPVVTCSDVRNTPFSSEMAPYSVLASETPATNSAIFSSVSKLFPSSTANGTAVVSSTPVVTSVSSRATWIPNTVTILPAATLDNNGGVISSVSEAEKEPATAATSATAVTPTKSDAVTYTTSSESVSSFHSVFSNMNFGGAKENSSFNLDASASFSGKSLFGSASKSATVSNVASSSSSIFSDKSATLFAVNTSDPTRTVPNFTFNISSSTSSVTAVVTTTPPAAATTTTTVATFSSTVSPSNLSLYNTSNFDLSRTGATTQSSVPVTPSSASTIFGNSAVATVTPSPRTSVPSIFGNTPTATTAITASLDSATGSTNVSFSVKPSFGSNQSVFGQSPSLHAATTSSNSNSGLFFGGGNVFGQSFQGSTPVSKSAFGTPTLPAGGALFSTMTSKASQPAFGTSPSFGSTGLGSPSIFGGAPTFGSAPAFGTPAVFGSPDKIFGQSPSASPGTATSFGGGQQSSTFANLASENTVTFGNLASQPAGFGASNFGTKPEVQNKSMFGKTSFNSWRSS